MIREWWSKFRRIGGIVTVLFLVANMTACGNGTRWIFSLNGEKLYHKEVDAFGFVYAMDHNITNEGQMEEVYEDGDTYAQHYKKELEDSILSGVLLQQKANDAGIQLSKDQKKECKKKAKALVEVYGKERLQDKKVEQGDIQKVYETIRMGELYIESVTQDEDTADDSAEKDNRYVTVYEALFPTVLFDKDGMLLSDTDGDVRQMSTSEKEEQYNKAQEMVQKITDGEEPERAAVSYGDSVVATKKHLKYADLTAQYQKALDGLDENEVSSVFEGTYGYYVIQLLDKDAVEYEEQVTGYEKQTKSQDARKEIVDQLYDSYVGTDKNYRNDKRWEMIVITDYLQ